MKAKSKLLLFVTVMLLGLTAATIINISLNFKEFSINSAIEKSELTAKIVEDGLTAHMVNGNMPQRQYFLDEISDTSDIKALWIVRSANVSKQYGDGFVNEVARDTIDREVIKTGKEVVSLSDENILRVTIPYIATSKGGSQSCISCHDVKVGETLGAISMELDITHTKDDSILVIEKIFTINLLFILVVLFLVNYFISPYVRFFKNLEDGIKKAYVGDFTHKFETTITENASTIASQMNTLFAKIDLTFEDIRTNLSTFASQNCVSETDPLNQARDVIHELSDIYKFKQTIERDLTKQDVYTRIVTILEDKFNITHCAFYEIDDIKLTRKLIYISNENQSICLEYIDNKAKDCRVYRTESDAISTEFKDICQTCNCKDLEYLCTFFNINSEVSLVLSFTATTQEEIARVNAILPNIKHYLEAAKPVIESQVLTEKLRETSLRDGMTGLYNRRFLEEFVEQIMHQAKREKETYSVLMLDVDHFKLVNDTYGHDVGDDVIVEIGKVLQESIREADLAIRYGGEEFVVMLHNANEEGTQKIATKIHKAFGDRVFKVGSSETIQKTMSIGISRFPTDADDIWDCIKHADTALYVAKTTGRNKIVNYEEKMSEQES